jgi:hypothetical protein
VPVLRVRIKDSENTFVYPAARKDVTSLIAFHLKCFRWEGEAPHKREVPLDTFTFEWVDGDRVESLPTPDKYPS